MKCSTAGIMPLLLKGLALFLCEVTQHCNLIASLTFCCIFQVFTGNKNTCMKILSYQVQKIMSLVALHTNKAPQFLDLLNAVVKVTF